MDCISTGGVPNWKPPIRNREQKAYHEKVMIDVRHMHVKNKVIKMKKLGTIGIVCLLVAGGFLGIVTFLNENVEAGGDSWTTKLSMPTARDKHGIGVVGGKIYVIGGYKSGSGVLDTVEVYDPASDTWEIKTPMPTPRFGLGIAVVNGKIYAIGGKYGLKDSSPTDVVEVYNPASDSWDTKTPMPTKRQYFGIGVVDDKIYTIGGSKTSKKGGSLWESPTYYETSFDTVEMYNPSSDSWTEKPPLPTPRTKLAVGVVDGKIYAIGGGTTVEEYNPQTNTWDKKTSMQSRKAFGIGVVNRKIYVIGGEDNKDNNLVQEYDPITDTWVQKTSLPTSRYNLAAGVVNGKIYAIGGYASGYLTKNEEYTPPTNTAPFAPQNLQAGAGDGSVTLTWDPPVDVGGLAITNYKIYRGTSSGGETLLTTVGSVLIYTDTSVTNSRTYYYKVSAVNGVGEGHQSNEASVTPTASAVSDTDADSLPDSWETDEKDYLGQEEEEKSFFSQYWWVFIIIAVIIVVLMAGILLRKKPPRVFEQMPPAPIPPESVGVEVEQHRENASPTPTARKNTY